MKIGNIGEIRPRFDNGMALSIKEVVINGNEKWRDWFFSYSLFFDELNKSYWTWHDSVKYREEGYLKLVVSDEQVQCMYFGTENEIS